MEQKEYTTADGKKGTEYKPQVGDVVVSRFPQPYKNTKGKFDNYSLGVVWNEKEIQVKLTKGQALSLERLGDINQKELIFYGYENKYGKQVGVKVND